MRYCEDCGEAFVPKGNWQKFCWRCWRARKEKEDLQSARDEGYDEGYAAGRREAVPPPTPLSRGILHDAVLLCHPDRHPPERSEQANRVTAVLLALLREV